MKAKYILAAITAMRAAENLGYTMEPKTFARIITELRRACDDLERESGLTELDVPIETDSVPNS